jgi:hypothetical protein
MESTIPPIPETERTPLVEELLAIIGAKRQTIQKLEADKKKLEDAKKQLEAELDRFKKRLAQYEPEVWYEGKAKSSKTRTSSASFSLDAEEKRRRHGSTRPKKSPGRRRTEVKFANATCTRDIYPEGVPPADCRLARERAVWRLENGQAVLVGYRIFAGPGGNEGVIPGVTPRCEYGIELLVVLAFLVSIIGISLDKACAVMKFFCGLPLAKSEADALLRQLAHHWEAEFDTLVALIAHAAVVALDETGWKVGNDNCSLWAFASSLHRVFLFGCHKDGATLNQVLPPDVFDGVGVSDDAPVYDRFTQSQKCWAHLLRKLIRLAVLYPRKKRYQQLLDDLLKLYHDAKRAAADERLDEAGRKRRVAEFEDRLCRLWKPYWPYEITSDLKPHERDFGKFINEVMRLCLDEELFTFVLVKGVEPTNNTLERLLRNSALDRKAGRTNKTEAGAHRRSVIVSVLESLRSNLKQFTLTSVLEEAARWMRDGISLFAEQWQKISGGEPVPHLILAPNTS